MKWMVLLTCSALCIAVKSALAQPSLAYVLSPSGSDTADCSLAAPCATLARAQSLMRTTSVKTTYLMSGTFSLPAPLTLSKSDNGEMFSAYPGQMPAVFPGAVTFSTPVLINNTANITISGLALSNAGAAGDGGDCIRVSQGSNIVLRQNQIGPCGGDGVHITGGTGNKVLDSYIHTDHRPTSAACCDLNEGVRVDGYASYVLIAGNVIAFSESNIELSTTSHVTADGNFLLNPLGPYPRGQNFQSVDSAYVSVTRNYAVSKADPRYPFTADQEDSINFYYTSGALAQANYVVGGVSPSGCAIIADAHTIGARFLGNIVFDSGECGIAISSGFNQVVSKNWILNLDPVIGGGNVGIYAVNYAAPYLCNNVTITNNVVSAISSPCDPATQACTFNSFYQNDSCTDLQMSGNVFDEGTLPPEEGAAFAKLISVVPGAAPRIPPFPHACVAISPYTTQTSMPSCR